MWRHDFGHPDGHGGEDHECAHAGDEAEGEELGNVRAAGEDGAGDDDEEGALSQR